jgi:hypothetical protein
MCLGAPLLRFLVTGAPSTQVVSAVAEISNHEAVSGVNNG